MVRGLGFLPIILALLLASLPGRVAGKITVHLVPHTHDDIGWLKTVDEYQYGLNLTIQPADVNDLITSAIGGLLGNPNRRFTYVEMGFFSRWWDQQNNYTKDNVRTLVGEQRLQFANGGWCMHDEAGTHFIDMIDQTTIGHRFLQREVNVVPKVGWQIDPFGHSATQAALLSAKAGFKGTYHARIDYQDYNYRAPRKEREFWWRASPSLPDATVFGEVLLDTTYCAPPGFDWDIVNIVPDIIDGGNTNFINDNPRSEQYNVPETLQRFLDRATQDAAVTRGEHILWPMGCDFNYLAGAVWFDNIDRLIKLVNADGRMEAKYSTPYDYTMAKLQENVSYVEMLGDFFPYADGPHQFWTGYFTSRAALKRYIRQLSSYWTASRQLQAFAGVASGELPTLSDALGIAQHHDAVAGTAKQHVAFDYAKRLHEGYVDDLVAVQASLAAMFGASAAASMSHCPLANVSVCPATAALAPTHNVTVVVWNPDAHVRRRMLVSFPVPSSSAKATGAHVVHSAAFPASAGLTNYAMENPDSLPFTLAVELEDVPASGFTTLTLFLVPTGASEEHQHVHEADGTMTFRTNNLSVTFSSATGSITSISNIMEGVSINITQDWCTFNSNVGDALSGQAGGAYIFRPVTNATCVSTVPSGASATIRVVAQSPNLFVVEQTFGYVVQRFVGHDDVIDLEFTIDGGIPIADGWGKELVARFQTNIGNVDADGRTVAYTDSNGREMMRRVQNERVDWTLVQTEEVAGNYYPVDAVAFINDSSVQLNIYNDAAMGGGSIHPGEFYLTVHRRLLKDDERGVTEPLNETEFVTSYDTCNLVDQFLFCGLHYGPPLLVRGRLTLSIASTTAGASPMRRTRELQDEKYFEPLVLFLDTPVNASRNSILNQPLPPSLQLVTHQLLDDNTLILRLAHRYAIFEDSERSAPVSVTLTDLLSLPVGWRVDTIDEYSLMTTELVAENVVVTTIGPMDVKTFLVRLSH